MRQTPLTALFVTCLVTAQVTSSKLIALTIPVMGAIAFPGGTLAYAGTFFASDVMGELHGKEAAQRMVVSGFAMNFVLLGLIYLTIHAPVAEGSISQSQFAKILGASGNIVAGSLVAYLLSQFYDVHVFHRLKSYFGGRKLWLRNLVSTGSSQFLDTVVFSLVAFLIAPSLFNIGVVLPLGVVWTIIVGQYIAKVAIAVIDTPFVYLAT